MTKVTVNRAQEQQARQLQMLAVAEALQARLWYRLLRSYAPRFAEQYALNGEVGLMVALEFYATDVDKQLQETWRTVMTRFGVSTFRSFKRTKARQDRSTYVDEVVVDWVNKFLAEKVKGIRDTATKALKDIIARGTNSGATTVDIAKDIKSEWTSLSKYDAYRIARTETHGAAAAGVDAGARATGLELDKQWLAAGDARTREAHAEADGQVVGMDESFTVGGEKLRFPGDPYGSAENVIQCRCTALYIPKELK